MSISRRKSLQAAAWTAPIIVAAIAAPAAAASDPTPSNLPLREVHFNVHADGTPGLARVKLGYMGERQGGKAPDVQTQLTILVNGVPVHNEGRLLVKGGYSGPVNLMVDVSLTEPTEIRYEVRYLDGSLALYSSDVVTPPKEWSK